MIIVVISGVRMLKSVIDGIVDCVFMLIFLMMSILGILIVGLR